MNRVTFLFIFLTLFCQILMAKSSQELGLELFVKSKRVNSGFRGEQSEMEMILINAQGDKVSRRMSSKVKETKGDGEKSIITFNWPADVKGTKMLTWSHKKGDDDQWLYLPDLKRVRRINSRSKTGSFMGSEFSYEDLSSQEVEKYTYKYIKEDKVSGEKCWLVERYPVDKDSGYSKHEFWMSQKYFNPLRIKYYDRKNELLKEAHFKKYKKLGKWWRVGEIEMSNQQTRKKSIMTWKKRKIGKSFSDIDFQKNNLKK